MFRTRAKDFDRKNIIKNIVVGTKYIFPRETWNESFHPFDIQIAR